MKTCRRAEVLSESLFCEKLVPPVDLRNEGSLTYMETSAAGSHAWQCAMHTSRARALTSHSPALTLSGGLFQAFSNLR